MPRSVYARCNRELERADLIICASDFVRDSMRYNGIPERKLAVNPYGTNTSIFKERTEPPEAVQFVTVGTMTVRKGHQYLFEAMRQVRGKFPQARLVVVGGVHNDFKRILPRWQGGFIHHPNLNHEALSQLLAQSTAFVFPSCEEGFARVISESMACGLPIIATHESGATTAVRNEVEGLIIPGRDPDALAAAMIRLIENRDLAASLGKAAACWARANGSWEVYGKRLRAIIAERLEKNNVRSGQ
jgi:glycosyltransferase involved in cell wall biosynthesis